MIIPEGTDQVYSRTFSSKLFKIVLFSALLWVAALIAVTVYYSRLSLKAARAVMLEEENDNLRGYLARVVDIEKSFKKNRELTARLAKMAGVDLEDLDRPPRIDLSSIDEDSGFGPTPAIPDTSFIALSQEERARQRIPRGRPLYGWITRPFSSDDGEEVEKHLGIDFAVKKGTAVVATASGVVIFAGWDESLGNLVIMNHGNGFGTLYGHNEKLLVEKGEEVLKGDVIAFSGSTGRSSAPHLHYEIRKDGEPVDPAPYLD